MKALNFNSENYKSYFTFEKFSALNEQERENLISFTVEQIVAEKGLKKVKVVFDKNMSPAERGQCEPKYGLFNQFKGHEMRLNADILNSHSCNTPYSTYNTIYHELEHAIQYENSANREIKNDNAAVLEQRLNDEHYYSADGDRIIQAGDDTFSRTIRFDEKTDYQLYRAQACEADARRAGINAVKELQKSNLENGIEDEYIDDYIEVASVNEIASNREMLKTLGMHSRENMAKEELSHISYDKVNEEDRKKVLEYARKKDFETAREVLVEDNRGQLTDEQLKQHFDNDDSYSDFYKSEKFQALKVQDFERDNYRYSDYKWDNTLDCNQKEQFVQLMTLRQKEEAIEDKREMFRKQICEQKAFDRNEQRKCFINRMENKKSSSEANPNYNNEIKRD